MEIGLLLATKLHAVTDAAKIFDGNTTTGAFRKFYNLFADPVILVTGVALLFLGKMAQHPLSRFCLFGLKSSSLATSNCKFKIKRWEEGVQG